METLNLTMDEQRVFASLPDELREGWKVMGQESMEEERPEQLELRYKMAHFDDPRLAKVFTTFNKQGRTSAALETAMKSVDMTKLSPEQLAELFFVLGIGVMNAMVTILLRSAKTDDDIEGIAGLTHIRSALYDANTSHS
jgi:hypothetical protein